MGSWHHCSICGKRYGREGGNGHRCEASVIENLERGRATWRGDAVPGRMEHHSFGRRLVRGVELFRMGADYDVG